MSLLCVCGTYMSYIHVSHVCHMSAVVRVPHVHSTRATYYIHVVRKYIFKQHTFAHLLLRTTCPHFLPFLQPPAARV